jgi:hypothetical protein
MSSILKMLQQKAQLEQEKRDETAEYLAVWKKTYSIEKTAIFLHDAFFPVSITSILVPVISSAILKPLT